MKPSTERLMKSAAKTAIGDKMDRLKTYWIKPEFDIVRFVKRTDESRGDDDGGEICPSWFKANYPGVCLFSKMEIDRNCLVKVWFFYLDIADVFKDRTKRDQYAYWVDPTCLVEIPV